MPVRLVSPALAVVVGTAQIYWASVDQRYEQSQGRAHRSLIPTKFCFRGMLAAMEKVVPYPRGRIDSLSNGVGATQW